MTGSADHGLRVYDSNTGKYQWELFNKKYGHWEWVSNCKLLPDGRIVSAGFDGIICVWKKNSVSCNQ